MTTTIQQFRGKRVLIIGFGTEGQAAAAFFHRHGAAVTVCDEREEVAFSQPVIEEYKDRGVEFSFGEFSLDGSGVDIVVRSPGVNPAHPLVAATRDHGAIVTSSTEVFFGLCPAPIIGVTGTKGKGTTSSLIYEMLKSDHNHAFLGGNIGIPPLSFLDDVQKDDWVILELSSFQLQDLTVSPHIAVVLMTTVEHQDYHASEREYVEAKVPIVKHQTEADYSVINWDYLNSRVIGNETGGVLYKVSTKLSEERGCIVRDGYLVFVQDGKEERIIATDDIRIPGKHNWENALAASCAAKLAGVETGAVRRVLETFAGLEHRLELIGEVDGVRYYNDSFSTTPETAIAAIGAFEEPKVMILGGSSKNSDFTALGRVISQSTSLRAIIGIGVEWERIKKSCQLSAIRCELIEGKKNMKEIVEAARDVAKKGDVVVLSPACASFDMFENYKDRGKQFVEAVRTIES